MPMSKTNFEQIPVDIVKKIAAVDPPVHEPENKKAPAGDTTTQAGWRALAERVQQEEDPRKMMGLVQNLIAKLDEEEIGKGRPHRADLG